MSLNFLNGLCTAYITSLVTRHWQVKIGQVIAWYYKSRIGGGFTFWPYGPGGEPLQISAPLWGLDISADQAESM